MKRQKNIESHNGTELSLCRHSTRLYASSAVDAPAASRRKRRLQTLARGLKRMVDRIMSEEYSPHWQPFFNTSRLRLPTECRTRSWIRSGQLSPSLQFTGIMRSNGINDVLSLVSEEVTLPGKARHTVRVIGPHRNLTGSLDVQIAYVFM